MKTIVLFTQQLIKRKKNKKQKTDQMKWSKTDFPTQPHQTPLFKTLKHEIGNATAININNVSNTVQTVAT